MIISPTILADFTTITLEKMDEVKLMDRSDTKFAFSLLKLKQLLQKLSEHYFILEVNGSKVQEYNSLYFDTEDRKLYLEHHNDRVNRHKIRLREYVGSQLTFLEIKRKNNKGKTIKKRIKIDKIEENLSENQLAFIAKTTGKNLSLSAKQFIRFSRITFVHKTQKERLTIDLDLQYEQNAIKGNLQNVVIAEVKQERSSRSSDFIRIAKELHILPTRLSKYCMTTIQIEPNIKQNRFKPKQLFINKLNHQQ